MRIILSVVAVLSLALPALADPPDGEPIHFKGRHLIALNVGVLTDVSSSSSVEVEKGVSVKADGFGGMAAIRYSYWFAEDLALDVSVGAVNADASVTASATRAATQSATVTRVLVGLKYQPLEMAMGRNIRPYAAGSLGPYSGNVSGVWSGVTATEIGSYTETAFGGRLSVGMDVLVKAWFAVGVEAGYGFVSDFDRHIGSQLNYSSPEFLISLGASLGGSW